MIKDLNASVAQRNLRLPALAGDETAAIHEFTRVALENHDRAAGAKYGLQYGEEFHYIGPDKSLDEYIARNAVRL
jgi:hypothetical protein